MLQLSWSVCIYSFRNKHIRFFLHQYEKGLLIKISSFHQREHIIVWLKFELVTDINLHVIPRKHFFKIFKKLWSICFCSIICFYSIICFSKNCGISDAKSCFSNNIDINIPLCKWLVKMVKACLTFECIHITFHLFSQGLVICLIICSRSRYSSVNTSKRFLCCC